MRKNATKRLMLGTSDLPIYRCRLPAAEDELTIFVHVRDEFDSMTEFQLPSIVVHAPPLMMNEWLAALQSQPSSTSSTTLNDILNTGDDESIGQIITSVSASLNDRNDQMNMGQ